VSLNLIMGNGYDWDSTNGFILRGKRSVCRVERHHRMFTLEYREAIQKVHTAIPQEAGEQVFN